MDSEPGPSNQPRKWVCVCRKHCSGQPRVLSETSFYRHLAKADEDERTRIRAVRGMSLEAAHLILSNARNPPSSPPSAAGPRISRSMQRAATLRGLAKRARGAPDAQRRVGKRKCARINLDSTTAITISAESSISNAALSAKQDHTSGLHPIPTSTVPGPNLDSTTAVTISAMISAGSSMSNAALSAEQEHTSGPQDISIVPNKEPKTSCSLANQATTAYTNSLDALAKVAIDMGITIPTPTAACLESENVPGSSSATFLQRKTTGKKVSKMRPGLVQNGRNLCAHRWLKTFKDTTNGTTAEFREYYHSLSKEQRKGYDNEAEDLVARKAWNKDAYNGPMYLNNLNRRTRTRTH